MQKQDIFYDAEPDFDDIDEAENSDECCFDEIDDFVEESGTESSDSDDDDCDTPLTLTLNEEIFMYFIMFNLSIRSITHLLMILIKFKVPNVAKSFYLLKKSATVRFKSQKSSTSRNKSQQVTKVQQI